jgi:glycosyltransferase involved in cell wall biosynthesis
MEAMACGCCPIASRVSGIPEIVTSSELGWLVENDDAAGLAATMAQALDQPDEARSAMGRRSRARIIERFSADTQFAILAAAIERAHARLPMETA